MTRRNAWFLNLDAEDELARPAGYTPSRAVLARIASLVGRLTGLLGPEDIVVAEGQSGALNGERRGMAWCPTPRADRALRRVGVSLRPAPALAVLRAVNHRRFNASLGQTLPGAVFAATLEEVAAALAGDSPSGTWLLKRPFGYAGRGRIGVEPGRPGDRERARTWIEASLRAGDGLQVEPLVNRCGDFALHGVLRRDGAAVLGEPTRQACDETGAWSGSERAAPDDLAADEREALFEEARRAARALHETAYFGPFGVDAFRWTDARGGRRFNARGEINARYSMGWAVGMGDRRPDLEIDEDG